MDGVQTLADIDAKAREYLEYSPFFKNFIDFKEDAELTEQAKGQLIQKLFDGFTGHSSPSKSRLSKSKQEKAREGIGELLTLLGVDPEFARKKHIQDLGQSISGEQAVINIEQNGSLADLANEKTPSNDQKKIRKAQAAIRDYLSVRKSLGGSGELKPADEMGAGIVDNAEAESTDDPLDFSIEGMSGGSAKAGDSGGTPPPPSNDDLSWAWPEMPDGARSVKATSNTIASLDYIDDTENLWIAWTNNPEKVYSYINVEPQIINRLEMNSENREAAINNRDRLLDEEIGDKKTRDQVAGIVAAVEEDMRHNITKGDEWKLVEKQFRDDEISFDEAAEKFKEIEKVFVSGVEKQLRPQLEFLGDSEGNIDDFVDKLIDLEKEIIQNTSLGSRVRYMIQNVERFRDEAFHKARLEKGSLYRPDVSHMSKREAVMAQAFLDQLTEDYAETKETYLQALSAPVKLTELVHNRQKGTGKKLSATMQITRIMQLIEEGWVLDIKDTGKNTYYRFQKEGEANQNLNNATSRAFAQWLLSEGKGKDIAASKKKAKAAKKMVPTRDRGEAPKQEPIMRATELNFDDPASVDKAMRQVAEMVVDDKNDIEALGELASALINGSAKLSGKTGQLRVEETDKVELSSKEILLQTDEIPDLGLDENFEKLVTRSFSLPVNLITEIDKSANEKIIPEYLIQDIQNATAANVNKVARHFGVDTQNLSKYEVSQKLIGFLKASLGDPQPIRRFLNEGDAKKYADSVAKIHASTNVHAFIQLAVSQDETPSGALIGLLKSFDQKELSKIANIIESEGETVESIVEALNLPEGDPLKAAKEIYQSLTDQAGFKTPLIELWAQLVK